MRNKLPTFIITGIVAALIGIVFVSIDDADAHVSTAVPDPADTVVFDLSNWDTGVLHPGTGTTHFAPCVLEDFHSDLAISLPTASAVNCIFVDGEDPQGTSTVRTLDPGESIECFVDTVGPLASVCVWHNHPPVVVGTSSTTTPVAPSTTAATPSTTASSAPSSIAAVVPSTTAPDSGPGITGGTVSDAPIPIISLPPPGECFGLESREGLLCRLYLTVFDRVPDAGGMNYWMAQDLTIWEIAYIWTGLPEWVDTYGGTSDYDFVREVYRNVFDRAPDAAGHSYWVARLEGDLTRHQMAVFFADSPEMRSKTESN